MSDPRVILRALRARTQQRYPLSGGGALVSCRFCAQRTEAQGLRWAHDTDCPLSLLDQLDAALLAQEQKIEEISALVTGNTAAVLRIEGLINTIYGPLPDPPKEP